MLRVAAPRALAVGVRCAGLEANDEAVGGADVDVAFGERGPEDYRLVEEVGEADLAAAAKRTTNFLDTRARPPTLITTRLRL